MGQSSSACASKGALLVVAAANGDIPVSQELLRRYPRAALFHNYKDRSSPLIQASARGHFELVQLVLETAVMVDGPEKAKRYCIDHVNSKRQSALMVACKHGHPECVDYLVTNGANPLLTDERRHNTCLHFASLYGHSECVHKLLGSRTTLNVGGRALPISQLPCDDASASGGSVLFIDQHNGWGLTALHIAVFQGSISTVCALLRHGADLSACIVPSRVENSPIRCASGSNALHVAALTGNIAMAKLILERQESVAGLELRGVVNGSGMRPQDYAARARNPVLMHLLDERLPVSLLRQIWMNYSLDQAVPPRHQALGAMLQKLKLMFNLELIAIQRNLLAATAAALDVDVSAAAGTAAPFPMPSLPPTSPLGGPGGALATLSAPPSATVLLVPTPERLCIGGGGSPSAARIESAAAAVEVEQPTAAAAGGGGCSSAAADVRLELVLSSGQVVVGGTAAGGTPSTPPGGRSGGTDGKAQAGACGALPDRTCTAAAAFAAAGGCGRVVTTAGSPARLFTMPTSLGRAPTPTGAVKQGDVAAKWSRRMEDVNALLGTVVLLHNKLNSLCHGQVTPTPPSAVAALASTAPSPTAATTVHTALALPYSSPTTAAAAAAAAASPTAALAPPPSPSQLSPPGEDAGVNASMLPGGSSLAASRRRRDSATVPPTPLWPEASAASLPIISPVRSPTHEAVLDFILSTLMTPRTVSAIIHAAKKLVSSSVLISASAAGTAADAVPPAPDVDTHHSMALLTTALRAVDTALHAATCLTSPLQYPNSPVAPTAATPSGEETAAAGGSCIEAVVPASSASATAGRTVSATAAAGLVPRSATPLRDGGPPMHPAVTAAQLISMPVSAAGGGRAPHTQMDLTSAAACSSHWSSHLHTLIAQLQWDIGVQRHRRRRQHAIQAAARSAAAAALVTEAAGQAGLAVSAAAAAPGTAAAGATASASPAGEAACSTPSAAAAAVSSASATGNANSGGDATAAAELEPAAARRLVPPAAGRPSFNKGSISSRRGDAVQEILSFHSGSLMQGPPSPHAATSSATSAPSPAAVPSVFSGDDPDMLSESPLLERNHGGRSGRSATTADAASATELCAAPSARRRASDCGPVPSSPLAQSSLSGMYQGGDGSSSGSGSAAASRAQGSTASAGRPRHHLTARCEITALSHHHCPAATTAVASQHPHLDLPHRSHRDSDTTGASSNNATDLLADGGGGSDDVDGVAAAATVAADGGVCDDSEGEASETSSLWSEDDTNVCSICMDLPVAVMVAGCQHGLCVQCAFQLCVKGRDLPSCPFCRQKIGGFEAKPSNSEPAAQASTTAC